MFTNKLSNGYGLFSIIRFLGLGRTHSCVFYREPAHSPVEDKSSTRSGHSSQASGASIGLGDTWGVLIEIRNSVVYTTVYCRCGREDPEGSDRSRPRFPLI